MCIRDRQWAWANGLTVGTNDGTTFSPDNACIRAEAVESVSYTHLTAHMAITIRNLLSVLSGLNTLADTPVLTQMVVITDASRK